MELENEVEKECEWKRPIVFHVKGTVILHIWPYIILIIGYTSLIVCLHNYVDALRMDFQFTLVPVLGVVTGLLLVFRTNTAYARYWEGRCLWAKLNVQIRHLTRLIWVGVEEEAQEESKNVKTVIEKTSAINLLIAFAFATKNHLREEFSYEEVDVKSMIGHLPRFRKFNLNSMKNSNVNESSQNQNLSDLVKSDNENKLSTSTNILVPTDEKECRMRRKSKRCHVKAQASQCPTNIPIEISFYIFSYVNNVVKEGLADGSAIYFMYDSLMTLVDCLTGFERIAKTPIPLAYGVHLHQAVYLFLLALPYQLVHKLNWWTIPAMTLASFAFLGILFIGREIENPFGYDDNDLPLDTFCKVIQKEIEMIVGNPMPSLDSWILSNKNYPLAPSSWLSADELLKRPLSELRLLLAKGSEFKGDPPVSTKWKKLIHNQHL